MDDSPLYGGSPTKPQTLACSVPNSRLHSTCERCQEVGCEAWELAHSRRSPPLLAVARCRHPQRKEGSGDSRCIAGGGGFRRRELADLNFRHFQQRKEHWAIVDLVGNGGHIRTVPGHKLGVSRRRNGNSAARSREYDRGVGYDGRCQVVQSRDHGLGTASAAVWCCESYTT